MNNQKPVAETCLLQGVMALRVALRLIALQLQQLFLLLLLLMQRFFFLLLACAGLSLCIANLLAQRLFASRTGGDLGAQLGNGLLDCLR